MGWNRSAAIVCLAIFSFGAFAPPPALAQDTAAAAREKQIADRFLQVLLRRPRRGTALDRVYGHHVQAGTLDELIDEQTSAAENGGDDAGAHLMLAGLLQSQRGRDAESAESFAEAENLRPDDAMASYYHGKALLLIGRTEQAAEAFERAIDREPPRAEALDVFTELGRLYQRAQQTDEALAVWQRLEDTFPGDARVGEQIAQTLAEEGQYDEALRRYEALAETSAASAGYRSVGYRMAAAELKRRMGRDDEALADFESLLARLRPSSWLYADVRRRIEAGFLRTGDYAGLAEYYAQQVDEQPDNVALRLRHGQTLAKAGRLNDAEAVLAETVELAPEAADARLALISVLKTAGKAAQAAQQLETLVEQDPENPDYLVQLGNTWLEAESLEESQRRKKAGAAWQRLAEARRDDAVVTAQVGDLMRRIERTDEALRLYRRAVRLAPDQPQYREYLGEYLHRLDRKDEALQTWSSIAEGSRATRDNWIRLAEVLNTFDYLEKALEAFAEAAELDPTFSQRLRFAELLSRAERYDDALAQLQQAERIAETPEDREQLLGKRISVYSSSGALDERIADTREKAEQQDDAETYRRLALMLDAAARLGEATEAIEAAKQAAANDPAVLSIAAELYRKASRRADAIDAYQKLAEIDARFLPNYLKRITGLQMQLGQIDQALETAGELITAQPGNPEAYRFYAEQCFRIGRDEEGIAKLRQALQASSRDTEAKRALASALAERFRTDEAIELYWQLIDATDELEEQKGWISSLAELYQRRGDFDRLLNRLELRGRESSDMRTATLLTAAAHRAASDLGSARQTLEPLLAENPRDAELLRQMVSLSEAADDPATALRYQQQLVALADTPEHRHRMLGLMVDSGQIDGVEAMLQRLRGLDDPASMVRLIDRTIRQGETEAAIRFCRTVLDQHSELWEVRTRLAALLLMSDETEQAVEQANRIAALELPADEKAVTHRPARTSNRSGQSMANPLSVAMRNSRLNSTNQAYYFGRLFRVGRYASISYSSSSQYTSALDVDDFAQAKFVATAVRLAAASKQGRFEEVAGELTDVGDVAAIADVEKLWQAYQAQALKSIFAPQSSSPSGQSTEQQQETHRLMWRLAELDDDQNRLMLVSRLLQLRQFQRRPNAANNGEATPQEPLNDKQLALAQQVYEKLGSDHRSTSGVSLANAMYEELKAAGKESDAEKIRQDFRPSLNDLAQVPAALRFHITAKRLDDVNQILKTIRQRLPEWADTMQPDQASELANSLLAISSLEDMPRESKQLALDLAIASRAVGNVRAHTGRRSSQLNGTLRASYRTSGGSYRNREIPVPFSGRLISQSLARSFYSSLQFGEESPERDAWLKHLSQDTNVFADSSDFAAAESQLRQTLCAFAHWWTGDVEAAYRQIVRASDAAPQNEDLWIERARLAAEMDRPEASLAALDQISPLNQATLRVRELAALNLASRLGRLQRAKSAARRLFGMRLDHETELALADQLSRLGMREMAMAVLQRSRRRGGQSADDLLQLAQRYMHSDEPETAAEVAFQALQKTSSGNQSNASYYRRQATELLKQAGRLEGLLQQAERRAAAAPKSLRLKTELAELYSAAGRPEDANRVLEQIAQQKPNDPQTLWSTGERLAEAGKHGAAVDKFLAAIAKDPELLRRDYYEFERAVTSGNQLDKAYESLTKIDLAGLDPFTVGRLTSLYRRGIDDRSEAAEAFLHHLLKESTPDSLGQILQDLSDAAAALQTAPVRDAIRRILDEDQIYQSQSRFWRGTSTRGGGEARGPLQPVVTALGYDDQLRKAARAMIARRTEAEAGSPVGELLLIAIDHRAAKPEEIQRRTKELMEQESDDIDHRVWWQLGQIFQEQEELQNLAIAVLEHAQESEDSSNYEFTAAARLTDAYIDAGYQEKARQQLLRGYQRITEPSDDPFGPSNNDYRRLQSSHSIAEKLVEIEAPLDAIRIYANTLGEPDRFRAARRMGSRDYREDFEQGLAEALEQLSEEDCQAFFTFEPTDGTVDEYRFDLVPLAATPGMDPAQSSIAALAATRLAETDEGRQTLTQFDRQVTQRLADHPNERSLAVAAALAATVLERDDAAERLKELRTRLPEIDPESEDGAERDGVLSWYSPVLVALESDRPAVRSEAEKLADRLITIATAQEKNEISQTLTLAKLKQGGESSDPERVAETMRALLEATVPEPAEGDASKVATVAMAEKCVRIAELSAKAGAWDVALQALRRGFGAGPPLRTVSQTGSSSSAFVLPSSRRTSYSSSGREPGLDPLIARIASLMQAFQDKPDAEKKPEDAAEAYTTLRSIVFPESRAGEVFPYMTDLSDPKYRATLSNKEELRVPSLARWLAVMAAESGQSSDLTEFLDAQEATAKSARVEFVRLHLALATKEKSATEQALRRLASRLGVDLAPVVAQPKDGKATTERPEDSGASSRPAPGASASRSAAPESEINLLLHAVLPAHGRFGATPAVAAVEMHLIKQSPRGEELAQLIESLSWMPDDLLRCEHVTDEQARRISDTFLSAVRRRYSNYPGDYGQRQVSSHRSDLARAALESGRWTLAGELLREFARENAEFQPSNTALAEIAIALQEASSEEQYEVLSQMMFGKDGSQRPASSSTMVLIAEPPSELRSVAAQHDQANQISVGHEDFPVASTALMLADAAAACGRTDELISRLRPHVRQPGDEAEAMIGLALLSADRIDAAAEPVARVVRRLNDTVPEQHVGNKPLPIEASLLAARCVSASAFPQQTAPAWASLLKHVRQRHLALESTFYNRMVTDTDLQPTAGAREGSPLKHFISVQLPHHRKPVCKATEPRYKLQDGRLHYAAGADNNVLLLKYPLKGDFTFSHRNFIHASGESHNTFGGVAYLTRAYNDTVRLQTLLGRNHADLPNDSGHNDRPNLNQIEVAGDQVVMRVNGKQAAIDRRTESMPFVGLLFERHVIADTSEITITGNPTIADEVHLIAPRLRGWSCPILGGQLLGAHLPLAPNQDAEAVRKNRKQQADQAEQQTNWYVDQGELRSGGRTASFNPGGQRHVQYQRPLLDGETISYEFFYQPDQQEVHPTIGRVAVLLRPGGVKLRWLPQRRSLESTAEDALHEIDPAEPLSGGKPKLLAGQWNRVTLTADESTVTVNVNGEAVCRFETARDRRFGLLGEKERSCRIRGATLSGPWPEKLPEDLMEKR